MTLTSGIYRGTIRHRRNRPIINEFTYPVFMALLDIDRLESLMGAAWCTSFNRFNWASYDDRDYLGDPSLPLRTRLERDAAANGINLPDGSIFLLTNLRYLGYSFNPVSFYYCFSSRGTLEVILAEVRNTFGERHNYWLDAGETEAGSHRRIRAEKKMHVSPFMPMELEYGFTFSEPGERLSVHMRTSDDSVALLDAWLNLERQEWSSRNILRTLAEYPWMTAKVITAIHWEALRLWIRKLPVFSHPNGLWWKV